LTIFFGINVTSNDAKPAFCFRLSAGALLNGLLVGIFGKEIENRVREAILMLI
jgi:hypothetical protein